MFIQLSEGYLCFSVNSAQILTVLLAYSPIEIKCSDDPFEDFPWPVRIVLYFPIILVLDFFWRRPKANLLIPEDNLDININERAIKLLNSSEVLHLKNFV